MADGALTIEFDEDLSGRLVSAAEEAGRPVKAYAAELIENALDDDWSETERRWAEFERTGDSVSVDEAIDALEARLREGFAGKR
jgi:predicted transcriptional regulator